MRNFILKYILLLSFGLFVITPMALAQSGGYAGAFTRNGFGAIGQSMGNAMSSVPDMGVFAHYNPALASFNVYKRTVSLNASNNSFDQRISALSANFKLPPKAGFSVHILNNTVSDLDERSTSGYHLGTFNSNEFRVGAAFGVQLNDKLNAGIGIKVNSSNLYDELSRSNTVGIDIGLLYKYSNHLFISLVSLDNLSTYSYDSSDIYGTASGRTYDEDFSKRYILGASYRKHKYLISIDLEQRKNTGNSLSYEVSTVDNTIYRSTSTVDHTYWSKHLRVGGAWYAHERITLRAGYRMDDLGSDYDSNVLNGGFSVHLPFDNYSPSFDYAYTNYLNLNNAIHTLGFRFTF